ncbi:MAG: patatin-like phospholipase family protein [Bdellovibrionota bacterium]
MKLGLALGGGGAKGFAHLGVLKIFEEAGVRFDVVAGSSIGSFVGAIYAGGTLKHFEREVLDIKLTDIPLLLSPAWSLSGFFSGENALDMLFAVLEAENIEDLKLPFAAVSVDLETSLPVVFRSGSLRHAIRSSISIPAIFTPVPSEQMLLVDGSMLEPVPIHTARELGADFVVAIDLFGNRGVALEPDRPEEPKKPRSLLNAIQHLKSLSAKLPWGERLISGDVKPRSIPTVVEIVERTLAVSQRTLTEYRLKECPPDVLVQPAVGDIGLLDFHRGALGIERGMQAGREALPRVLEALEHAKAHAGDSGS